MTRDEIIRELRGRTPGHALLVEGSRNNDSVNLAIVAYADSSDREGLRIEELNERIVKLIDDEDLPVNDETDWGYLEDKCGTLMPYLRRWYDTGDIYQFAVI